MEPIYGVFLYKLLYFLLVYRLKNIYICTFQQHSLFKIIIASPVSVRYIVETKVYFGTHCPSWQNTIKEPTVTEYLLVFKRKEKGWRFALNTDSCPMIFMSHLYNNTPKDSKRSFYCINQQKRLRDTYSWNSVFLRVCQTCHNSGIIQHD